MRLLSRLAASRAARVGGVLVAFAALVVAASLLVVTRGGEQAAPPVPAPAPTTPAPTAPPPPPETEPPPPPAPTPPPPASVPFSWTSAGAFVWHETDVEPTLLGRILREAGFGWVAVRLHDGTEEDPVEADWVYRFRLASGLPVIGTPIRTLADYPQVVRIAANAGQWSLALAEALDPAARSPDKVLARQAVARNFDWQRLAAGVADVIRARLGLACGTQAAATAALS